LFSEDVIQRFVEAFWITVQLVLMAGVLGTAMSILSGLAGLSPHRTIRWINQIYVDFFRGSAAIILLFWAFYTLPVFSESLSFSPMQAGVVVLGLNMGGYGSEVVRGAVRAVDRGQYEACTALSIVGVTRMRYVIFPQAVLAMLPPYGNLLIEMMKATALVSLITLPDIIFTSRSLIQINELSTFQGFMIALVLYYIIAQGLAFGVRRLEGYARHAMGVGS
jgi:polar amino acid transport system permease protein